MQILSLLRMAPWVAILVLLAYAGRLNDLRERHLHRAEAFQAQLKAISTAKDEQKTVTKSNVVKAGEGRKSADRIAKRIEAAPVTGQCHTPEAVLSADL